MKFADIVRVTQATVIGEPDLNALCQEFSTDSRNIQAGQIFVALQGEHFDGHDFINQVFEAGAAAALVNRVVDVDTHAVQLLVKDTLQAYGQIAAFHAKNMPAKKIAITGSSGKTTVKQMLSAVFSEAGKVCATQGNFNNDIGVPRTLLSIKEEDAFAVVEMGANHAGEIAYLSSLLHADAVSIINADRAHLEGFGSVEGVAHAKGEIFSGAKKQGLSILSMDESYFPLWKTLSEENQLTVLTCSSKKTEADVYLLNSTSNPQGSDITVKAFGETFECQVPFAGEHNVRNALLVITFALGFGLSVTSIRAGLCKAVPEKGRLNISVCANGITVIDDTYNANPLSMKAAIQLLAQYQQVTLLIVGDMGELGDEAASLHREIGEYAAQQSIDYLLACGDFAECYVEGYASQKMQKAFSSQTALLDELPEWLSATQAEVILVKGSRFTRMEKVVDFIREWGEAA